MLIAEYDYDTDIAVQRQESLMIGIQQGIEQGIQQGMVRGMEQGSYQKAFETATAFKRLGIDIEKIAEGTGLSVEEIEKLSQSCTWTYGKALYPQVRLRRT